MSAIGTLADLLLILMAQFNIGLSEIIVRPRDTETVVGETTYLNCSISESSRSVTWYYYPATNPETIYIYLLGKLLQDYENRARIERHTNPAGFNLVIQTVNASDTGKYVCQEEGESGQFAVAELIVLDRTPVCGSNMTVDSLIIGANSCCLDSEDLLLSCEATYQGRMPPIINWVLDGKDLAIPQQNYSNHVSSLLSINVPLYRDQLNFVCQTTRSAVHQYSCTMTINVTPVSDKFRVSNKNVGETATCLVNGSLPCTYKWKRDENGKEEIISNDSSIVLLLPGLYRCEAECKIKEKSCLLIAGQVLVASKLDGDSAKCNVYCVLFVLAIIWSAIATCVCCWLKLKMTRKKTNRHVEMGGDECTFTRSP